MASTRHDRPGPRRTEPPLYDARFEHDACGVGFVADAGGRSRDRVLPLALAGLAALGHRGAFGADGESSDGAGVSLPLDASLLSLLAGPDAGERPGIAFVFLPRRPAAARAGRALVGAELRRGRPDDPTLAHRAVRSGRARRRGRRVDADDGPGDRGPPDRRRRATRCATTPSNAGWSSRGAASSRRSAPAPRRLAELSVPSASCRTIVYKGLVTGARLPDLYPDLRAPLSLGYAVFHQRYATNTHPVWRLAQPFRSIAHNGEINTVRGNREQVRGRTGDRGARPDRRRPPRRRPAALAGRLGLALPRRGARAADRRPAGSSRRPCSPRSPRRSGCAARPIRTSPRSGAGRPGSSRRGTGRRRSSSPTACASARSSTATACGPASFAVTRDRLVVAASEAGAIGLEPSETIRRGRLGSGRAAAGRARATADPRGHRREGARAAGAAHPRRAATGRRGPRRGRRRGARARGAGPDAAAALPRGPRCRTGAPRHQDDGARGARAALEHGRRHADARARPARPPGRRPPAPGVRAGHEPGDRPRARTHRAGPARGARPPAGAPRRAAARTADAATRPAHRGGPRRAARPRRPTPGRRVRRLDATWRPADGPAGLEASLDRIVRAALRAAASGVEILLLSDRDFDLDRLPVPSILAVGAVHTALTDAGLRGRTDLVVDAGDVLDVHAMAMTLAVGATAVHPRLAIELAAELAGTRGAETVTTADGHRGPHVGLRGRPAQDPGPDGHQRGRVVHRWLAHRRRGSRRERRRPLLPDGGGVARPDDPRRPGRAAARGGERPRRPSRRPPRAASRASRTRVRAVPRRRRGPPLRPEDRDRDHDARHDR